MANRYPIAYRKGAPLRTDARLSRSGGPALLEEVLRNTNNARALERAIIERNQRNATRGTSRIPNVRGAARAAKGLRGAHPLQLALKMLAMLQEATRNGAEPTSQLVPGLSKGGSCPITEPLDYSDIRAGLPSVTCQTGQAVGPGYNFHCGLGAGIWVKRAAAFNYNQLSWWTPLGN